MKVYLFLLLCSLHAAFGQFAPAIFVEGEKESRDQLRVDQLEIKVLVIGNIAETSMTMRFRNDTNHVLEGEFVCPLNEGQNVTGYSLEIESEMRAGVAVEKQQARQVFEDIVRGNIDPGLAELTKGNNFRTRVYPIPAKGTKRVGVTFRETLPREGEQVCYRLPLQFKKSLSRFSISILAPHAEGESETIEDSSSGLTFKQTAKRGWRLGSIRKNFTPLGPLEVKIPTKRGPIVAVGHGPQGKKYFYLSDRELVPEEEGAGVEPVKSIHLVWDASGSGSDRDHGKELKLLRDLLNHHEGATVRLTLLRHEVESVGSFTDIESLVQKIEGVTYDGGSDPGRLDLTEGREDLVVLVSDGIGTMGRSWISPGKAPVHVFHAARTAEHDRLRFLAWSSGGRHLNLNNHSPEDALKRLIGPVFQLLAVDGVGDDQIQLPVEVSSNGMVDFSGVLKGDEPITLTLGYGYSGKVVRQKKIVVDPIKDLIAGDRVAALWGGHQLRSLMEEREKNREKITELGKKYGLVTPYTSLLVLDRIEDYVEHRIVPPSAKLRKEYERLVKLEEAPRNRVNKVHLDDLLIRWKEIGEWHGKDYDQVDVLLQKRLVTDRKKVGELLKRRFFSRGVKVTKEERKELTEIDRKLAALQTQVLQFAKVPRSERRKVITEYASRYAVMRKSLYGGKNRVADLVTAGNRSGAGRVLDGILRRTPSEGGGGFSGGSPPASPAPSPPAVEVPMMAMGPGEDAPDQSATITLARWDPKTPYLSALRKTSKSKQEAVYLEWKKKNLRSSAFYLDVSGFFLERGQKELALRVVTNVAEFDLDSAPLMRVLAHRLNQWGEHARALAIFEEVLELRPEEPQSKRDVALTLASLKRYQEAGDLLWQVVKSPVDDRFEGIHLIALVELNALVSRHGIRTSSYDRRFIRKTDCDARIVLTWDSNDSDMDLWVTDPLGELCNYATDRTEAGGRMSDDFTDGYGPEEFLVKEALHGKYRVEVNFFGTRQQIIAGETTIQVELFTNWGRKNQKSRKVILRLKEKKELVYVGEFELR